MLPDILHRFSFLHNKYFTSYNPQLLNAEGIQLWKGIEQHYADDSFFHSFSFFKNGMVRIEEEMKDSTRLNELKRKYLISHVLYELILDHMILERQSEIVSDIYTKLAEVEVLELKKFLENIIGKNEEIGLFLDSYGRFLNRRFLNFYAVESNLIKSLHMVSGKISQWEYEEKIVQEFAEIIKKIKKETDFDLVFDCIFKHKDIA
jgi:hypothetical protein